MTRMSHSFPTSPEPSVSLAWEERPAKIWSQKLRVVLAPTIFTYLTLMSYRITDHYPALNAMACLGAFVQDLPSTRNVAPGFCALYPEKLNGNVVSGMKPSLNA